VSVLIIIGVAAGMVAWFYRRGAQEREMALALKANTTSNEQLTRKMDEFRDVVVSMLHALDVRVTLNEAAIEVLNKDKNAAA
jgi:hypothetical protein